MAKITLVPFGEANPTILNRRVEHVKQFAELLRSSGHDVEFYLVGTNKEVASLENAFSGSAAKIRSNGGSINTIDNVKKVLDEFGTKGDAGKVVMVTGDFEYPRADYYFRRMKREKGMQARHILLRATTDEGQGRLRSALSWAITAFKAVQLKVYMNRKDIFDKAQNRVLDKKAKLYGAEGNAYENNDN